MDPIVILAYWTMIGSQARPFKSINLRDAIAYKRTAARTVYFLGILAALGLRIR
jgi:hypothetical protein